MKEVGVSAIAIVTRIVFEEVGCGKRVQFNEKYLYPYHACVMMTMVEVGIDVDVLSDMNRVFEDRKL